MVIGNLFTPFLLKGNADREWVEFKAFVDSGAGYSVFQAEMAEILGLSLENGEEEYVTVGDGSQIKVYIPSAAKLQKKFTAESQSTQSAR